MTDSGSESPRRHDVPTDRPGGARDESTRSGDVPGESGAHLELWKDRAEWLRGEGEASDVVLSSRVRLARNVAGFPFVTKASRTDRRQIIELCKQTVLTADLAERVVWIDLQQAPPLERTLLVERQLISKQHSKGKLSSGQGGPDEPRGVALGLPGERLSIMVNEEDHLRIQLMRTGLALGEVVQEIDAIDDRIEAGIDYAFHPRFGYLAACPTNVGTAARLSVMLHLPALKLTGELDKVKRAADDMSLAVRGFYGEGSEASGDLYQLSNQTTLGKTHEILLYQMEAEIVPTIVEYERRARAQLLERRREGIMDQAHRALGLLAHARMLSVQESMTALSSVRLGVVLGLIEEIDGPVLNQLMLIIQPAHIQRLIGREMRQDERRVARAELVRSRLSERGII